MERSAHPMLASASVMPLNSVSNGTGRARKVQNSTTIDQGCCSALRDVTVLPPCIKRHTSQENCKHQCTLRLSCCYAFAAFERCCADPLQLHAPPCNSKTIYHLQGLAPAPAFAISLWATPSKRLPVQIPLSSSFPSRQALFIEHSCMMQEII